MASGRACLASSSTDVDDFVTRASACTKCGLSATRQHVVVGAGPWTAALALVGEAPGRAEDEEGQPFIGASGRVLFDLVRDEMGLEREQCYVTSVVKCRPPNNRAPTKTEIGACREWWNEQLTMMSARVIVTLGNTSTRALMGTTEGITTLHGRVIAFEGRSLVPTFHPAAVLRHTPGAERAMRADLRLAATLIAELAS